MKKFAELNNVELDDMVLFHVQLKRNLRMILMSLKCWISEKLKKKMRALILNKKMCGQGPKENKVQRNGCKISLTAKNAIAT